MARTVLVTGGARGLGQVISKTLAEQGFNIIIDYNQSKEAAEQLAQEIGNEKAIALQADVTNRKEVDQLVKEGTEKFGQID
ncbi:SDR family NAD(P)-dependent oxidoreductase, partial [Staphylococcus carnosus]